MQSFATKLANSIEKLSQQKQVFVAIDGMSCSGKTTLANILAEKLLATKICLDDFFLPNTNSSNKAFGFSNFDVDRFLRQIPPQWKNKNKMTYQKFDCKSQLFSNFCETAKKIVIVEGTYSLCKELRHLFDLKVLLRCSEEVQLKRLCERESESSLKQFQSVWLPLEKNYFLSQKPSEIADFVFCWNDQN